MIWQIFIIKDFVRWTPYFDMLNITKNWDRSRNRIKIYARLTELSFFENALFKSNQAKIELTENEALPEVTILHYTHIYGIRR